MIRTCQNYPDVGLYVWKASRPLPSPQVFSFPADLWLNGEHSELSELTMERSMPCRSFKIGIPRINPIETINRYYDAAFGTVPEFFKFVSWCGWRPICEEKQLSALMAALGTRRPRASDQSPRIDVYETRDALIIEVALADIRKESLYLEMVANGLIIRGERRPGVSEIAQGDTATVRFQRFVRLPEATRTASIKAETKGNVVKIDIRKQNG